MRDTPLRGVSLHNPQLLSKDELVRDFVARQAELARLVDDLRRHVGRTPQHHLVLGHRGMGKSTLLHRLAYAVLDDPELSAAYLPLAFPEEQYNIARLSDLWLNCLDALSDRLEASGDAEAAARLDDAVDELHAIADDAVLEERARETLLERGAATGRRLLLLLDNIDLVLERIGKDRQWALRETLQHGEIVVVGASAVAVESSYDYGDAFYDFFRVHKLGPLTHDEVRDALLALARRHGDERVGRVVAEEPGRVEALRVLSGGNPRTIATLYEVLAAGRSGTMHAILAALLDRQTPLYKARFEAMAPQAQQVVDALCVAWNPTTASEIAERTRLPVTTISSQLSRLEKDGLVEKVPSVDTQTGERRARHSFQMAERFFNLWYLMRASRRSRTRLQGFVSFLEVAYGSREPVSPAEDALPGFVSDAVDPSVAYVVGVARSGPANWVRTALESPDDGVHLRTQASRLIGAGRAAEILAAIDDSGAKDALAAWRGVFAASLAGDAVLDGLAPEVRDASVAMLTAIRAVLPPGGADDKRKAPRGHR